MEYDTQAIRWIVLITLQPVHAMIAIHYCWVFINQTACLSLSTSAMAAPAGSPPHIVMFTTAGKGHLFPFVELARKILAFHNFAITVIIPDDGSPTQPQKNLLETIPTINPIFLPPITLNDVAADAPVEIPLVLSVTRSTPALCDALSELNRTAPISALVIDMFGSFVVESVKKLGIPSYIFYPGSAMMLSFVLYFPDLDRERPEPLRLPGCVPVHGSDIVNAVQDPNGPAYELCVEMYRKFSLVDAILVDSFLDLEPDVLKALEEAGRSGAIPPIYPVGPLVRLGLKVDGGGVKEDCVKWLDEQPDRSVLYVSFGSGGTLSSNQLEELALGLEMSGQRILMVARPPNDKIRSAAYFTTDADEMNPSEYLPVGFVERTKGKAFVVSHWAPQVEVLSHAAVGGFLTHCGWNSTLESIVHGGVPLIAWPLFAEQRMNAVLLSEGLKVAMRVTEDENGVVDRVQISRMVRSLIEGEEGVQLREKMRNLKKAAHIAMGDDGSSTNTLGCLVEKWK